MTDPIRPTDDEARALAGRLIDGAAHGALGTLLPGGRPMVTRVAVGTTPGGAPCTLVSDLSEHTRALRDRPDCSLLLGEPGPKGDPLTHPRLTILARARFVDRTGPDHADLAAHYLRGHPKAKLYIGFADFSFAVFDVAEAHLNGGFGKAFRLTPADLGL